MKTRKYRYAFSPHSHKNQVMKFIIYSFPVLKQVSSSTRFRENCYELNYYYVIWIHYSHNKYNFRSDYKYLSFLFSLYTSGRLSSFKIFQETSIFLKKGRGLEPNQHSPLLPPGKHWSKLRSGIKMGFLRVRISAKSIIWTQVCDPPVQGSIHGTLLTPEKQVLLEAFFIFAYHRFVSVPLLCSLLSFFSHVLSLISQKPFVM